MCHHNHSVIMVGFRFPVDGHIAKYSHSLIY